LGKYISCLLCINQESSTGRRDAKEFLPIRCS
jgi:hypothetical protein